MAAGGGTQSMAGAVATAPVATAPVSNVPVTAGRDAARQAAQRELSNPAYHQHDGNPVQQAFLWLWDRLGQLLDRAALNTPGGWAGLAVCILLVAGLLGALVWRLGRPGARRRAGDAASELFTGAHRTAAQHRAAARRHAEECDWNAAVRERMRALVRSLEERALLDARPGRTADEAARAAGRALPAHAAELAAAARVFDDVHYGGRSATEADYRQLADLDDRLTRTRPADPSAPEAAAAGPGVGVGGPAGWAAPGETP